MGQTSRGRFEVALKSIKAMRGCDIAWWKISSAMIDLGIGCFIFWRILTIVRMVELLPSFRSNEKRGLVHFESFRKWFPRDFNNMMMYGSLEKRSLALNVSSMSFRFPGV